MEEKLKTLIDNIRDHDPVPWIAVEEALPDKGEWVICYAVAKNGTTRYETGMICDYTHFDKLPVWLFHEYWPWERKLQITHWKPFGKIPKFSTYKNQTKNESNN